MVARPQGHLPLNGEGLPCPLLASTPRDFGSANIKQGRFRHAHHCIDYGTCSQARSGRTCDGGNHAIQFAFHPAPT